jgi:hypothetical protein
MKTKGQMNLLTWRASRYPHTARGGLINFYGFNIFCVTNVVASISAISPDASTDI